MTKREWQIEMANRFAKRDNVKELEAKLECYERLVDSINMASKPMSEKSRVMLKNVREMKTIHDGAVTTPSQREWVGLTDEELTEIRQKTFDSVATNHEVYRVIEAKLKEKNI